jgi:hypothetical protein
MDEAIPCLLAKRRATQRRHPPSPSHATLQGLHNNSGRILKCSTTGVLQRYIAPEDDITLLRDIHEGTCGHYASSQMIRPKRIYFLEHFCYCFSSNLYVLNKTNMDNAVFSRIALVSCFCAEIQLSGKILENTAKILFYHKTHGARIQDGEGPGGRHTTWWRDPGLSAPRGGAAAPAVSSTPPSAYIYPLT